MYLNVNGGVSGAVRGGFSASADHKISVGFQEEKLQVYRLDYRSTNFYFNTQVSTGLYIIFDKFMLRTNVLYNKSFKDIQAGEYRFRNLHTSPSENGTLSFTGDYFGISTTIYFKRKN